jgi:deoxycytidylate deaminase
VGAILVAPASGGIIAEGFNGTPAGFDNRCELEEIVCQHTWDQRPLTQDYLCVTCLQTASKLEPLLKTKTKLVTKEECIHAESNAIMKVARSNNSSVGSTLYCTLTPCFECSKLIIQAGIIRVVYAEWYPYAGHAGPVRALGIELLQKATISIAKLDGFIEH